jgi:hypothetical protein
MKKTYPGQSNALTAYCIRAIIVSIVILGSVVFLSANAGQAIPGKSISPIIKMERPLPPAMISCYKNESSLFAKQRLSLQIRTFFKGYDQQTAGLF